MDARAPLPDGQATIYLPRCQVGAGGGGGDSHDRSGGDQGDEMLCDITITIAYYR